jgi:hypothetical protein
MQCYNKGGRTKNGIDIPNVLIVQRSAFGESRRSLFLLQNIQKMEKENLG